MSKGQGKLLRNKGKRRKIVMYLEQIFVKSLPWLA